ncbi:leukocyte elastase inhibitor-like isoform X2 [Acanthaster planci]|uniref:Leukocyte elastase inhibitor-like isoform X2 n=1 Tax=Acanthaster planci TaxID=133434 RepID=A0A8B7Z5X4_ACAPL|nr:leukocyte elastase inhibitor-like isoform X2 [Acanthaster planci]
MAVIQFLGIFLTAIAVTSINISGTSSDTDTQLNLAEANNRFAFHLYQTLTEATASDNIVFSPMSISIAFGMTFLGARGNTANQMKEVLKFNLMEESRLHSSLSKLNSAIFDVHATRYILRKANRLFGQKDLDLRHQFLHDVQKHYGSSMASLDFVEDSEGSRQFINSWVSQETEEKIVDVLPPGHVNEMTRLVLVNAIYFKADWISKFDASKTFDQDFYFSESEVIEVAMMHRKSKFNFAEDTSLRCKIIELPYVGKKLSMVLILPEEINGLDTLLKHFSNEKLLHFLNNLSNVTVDLAIPKFSLEETVFMNDVLHTMGMQDLFRQDKADLSGITGTKDLFVSTVVHRAFLEVNEEGSEAAAATAVTISARSISHTPEFIADHPFLFFIIDSKTKAIIFMGNYRKPVGLIRNREEL